MPEAVRRSGKAKSVEELHMQSKLPPVAHSSLISNDYELAIEIEYGGSNCGVKKPYHCVPLTLVNDLHKNDCYMMQEPEGFDPIELSNFHIELEVDKTQNQVMMTPGTFE